MKKIIITTLACLFHAVLINAQVWERTYGVTSHYEICTSVVNEDDDGFIMGISRDSRAMWIVKTDINGNLLWD